MEEIKRIKKLIIKKLSNKITEDELLELKKWENNSDHNKKTYHNILKLKDFKEYINITNNINIDESWKELKLPRNKIIPIFKYAAAIIALLLIPFTFIYINSTIDQKQASKIPIVKTNKKDIKIILNNGEEVCLLKEQMAYVQDSIISIKNNPNIEVKNHSKPHKIIVPRGAEFQITLSDGTTVLLNSESELIFPNKFTGKKRIVQVKGEAYFNVAKDKEHPFVVNSNEINIMVTGTQFNVKSYPNENIQTTLIEGGINIYYKKKKFSVIPNQQAELINGEIVIKEIDTNLFTSWTKKKLIFRDQRLEEIMSTISRWYDVEVFFQNEDLKDIILSAKFDRYKNVSAILDCLSKAGYFKVEINKRTIIIK
jgi:ferric-dicitrate binding protein FerR (iron transport regulator)